MKLEFIGADHEVTGSCHLLQVGAVNILIDYGMEQGRDVFENVPLPVPASKINYVFLTHAHIDHSGMLPKLYKDGFRGQILTTGPTKALCDIMLRDSAHIQEQEAQWKNKKGARTGVWQKIDPVYTVQDAVEVMKLFQPCRYGKRLKLCNGVEFRFTDVGHLLGSASIEFWLTENEKGVASGDPVSPAAGTVTRKIVFSGDIGNSGQALLRDPIKTDAADYVVMESTYGDRLHDKPYDGYVKDLADIIRTTLLRGGNLIIPSFAVGRTQEMLYFIRKVKLENLIPELPDFPVYVDSPLAVEATSIFDRSGAECFDAEAMEYLEKGINPLTFPGLKLSVTTDDSKAINTDDEPKVIISASGMCDAGRIKHHLKYNLWRRESTILFVGYQSEGTVGRRIVDGADTVRIFGEPIAVRAEVKVLPGLSGHADQKGLLDWLGGFGHSNALPADAEGTSVDLAKAADTDAAAGEDAGTAAPQEAPDRAAMTPAAIRHSDLPEAPCGKEGTGVPLRVFIVHGEDSAATHFAQLVTKEYGYDANAPYSGTVFDLAANEFVKITEGIPAEDRKLSVAEEDARYGRGGRTDLRIGTGMTDGRVREGAAAQGKQGSRRVYTDAYTGVCLAERELSGMIEGLSGMNKELEALAAKIRALTEEYRINKED